MALVLFVPNIFVVENVTESRFTFPGIVDDEVYSCPLDTTSNRYVWPLNPCSNFWVTYVPGTISFNKSVMPRMLSVIFTIAPVTGGKVFGSLKLTVCVIFTS